MSLRHFLFIFYTLLFFFYPGNSYYFHLFAYNRSLFNQQQKKIRLNKVILPYLKDPFFYPEISAQGLYIVDLDSFTPIWSKNANSRFLPASLTKIITALVSIDIYKPDQIIEVKKTITDGQIMNLYPGEKITVENLLYGILVHSANDAAFVLADNYGYEKFINLMNQKAKELKMENTKFYNPTGLEDKENLSTPFDLALAARELLKNKYLSKIASTKEIVISDANYQVFHKLTNVNQLLGEIPGIGGLKTGYTENAGENLITFYKKNNHQLLIVILKSLDRFQDTRNIIYWLENNLAYLYL